MIKKFKQWLANKPKWIQWLIGTNLGWIVINTFFLIVFTQLAEYVARVPYNTIAIVLFFILLLHIIFWAIVGIINSIKDGRNIN